MVGSVGNGGMCKHGAGDVVGSKPKNSASTGLLIPCPWLGIIDDSLSPPLARYAKTIN